MLSLPWLVAILAFALYLLQSLRYLREDLEGASRRIEQLEAIANELQGDRLLLEPLDTSHGRCDWCGDPLGPNDGDICERCEWSAKDRGDDTDLQPY